MYEDLIHKLRRYAGEYRSGATLGRMIEDTEDIMDEAATAIETQSQWISVKDKLPEPEVEVLIIANCNNRKTITTAMYENGEISIEESIWYWSDYEFNFNYDEEKDEYLIPEGWWEYRHYNPDEVYNNEVEDVVTHWMPLPEPPKEEP